MEKINVSGGAITANKYHELKTPVFIFNDGSNWIYYSPALDLSGYGATRTEANSSFEVALKQLITYIVNKKTAKQLFVSMGWRFTKAGKAKLQLTAPSLMELLNRDEYLQDIFDKNEFEKINRNIGLPVMAMA
ncbi:MAG: hypothetical protein AAGF85_00730 [Bacteroidota bacterium]